MAMIAIVSVARLVLKAVCVDHPLRRAANRHGQEGARHMNGIHWTRVIAAAILSEVGVYIALFTSFGIAMLLTGISWDTIVNSTGEDISYYVAPPAALVMTTLATLWATRPLTSGIVRHGVLIGFVAVLLTFAFIFG